MKKITILSVFLLGLFFSQAQELKRPIKKFGKEISAEKISPSGHIRCATDEYENYLQSIDPTRKNRQEFETKFAPIVEYYKNRQEVSSESGGIIYIPVVVHVIHNGDDYGVSENITDEQVESQITVMTQDFRRMMGTPGYNTNPVGADIQIEFVLAKSDPNGNPSNGITRTNMCQDYWEIASVDATVKPATIWDPTLYMNMWSVNFGGADSDILGYAQFPSSGTATANTDGVVAGYGFFGSSDLAAGSFSPPYDKGRTMTHEVGHFLGLYHTFQGGCNAPGDSCNDTPAVAAPNFGCPGGTDSCAGGGADMIENYMDYTDDTCMNVFTNDQKSRVVAVMNTFPRRLDLRTSTKDMPIALFANDAEVVIDNICSVAATCSNPNPASPLKVVMLYNRGTSNITSASINYNMNGGTNYVYNYSGAAIAPNKFVYISLPNTAINGTLNTTIATVNGVSDQRVSNDTASKTFGAAGGGVADFPYTAFTFELIGDPWGDETTWELRNSSNTIVYSGGPYTFTGVAGTQVLENNVSWTLPIDCYTFTIFDSYGDGMGGSGNGDAGSWTIRTNGGATTVASGGGNFGNDESASFTNASLSVNGFALDAISIYPNPTKDILNIAIPNELGSNVSFDIVNYLGQSVLKSASTNNNFSVNTSGFSTGVYFIKLQTESGSKTFRFIKN